jgi:hypothetical protein
MNSDEIWKKLREKKVGRKWDDNKRKKWEKDGNY